MNWSASGTATGDVVSDVSSGVVGAVGAAAASLPGAVASGCSFCDVAGGATGEPAELSLLLSDPDAHAEANNPTATIVAASCVRWRRAVFTMAKSTEPARRMLCHAPDVSETFS